MTPHELSVQELLDIIPRYFAPIRREDLEDSDVFNRLEATSPEYRAWLARRQEGWNHYMEWRDLVVSLKPLLPEYDLWNQTAPVLFSSYEAEVYRNDAPKAADGVIRTSLVIRMSCLAPVYEMYESSARVVWKPHMERLQWADHRRTHELSPAFQPAADAFARAIEEHYRSQRLGPEVLDIQLFNVAIWEKGWYTGTLAEALFSEYRL
jgi:hypothetical protein